MAISRKRALEYAERALERPSSRVMVTLRHGKGGVTLLHRGRALTKCHATLPGRMVAPYLAEALGLELPEIGKSASVETTTGVLHRVIGISMLDLRHPAERTMLERLLEEAEGLRRLKSASAM